MRNPVPPNVWQKTYISEFNGYVEIIKTSSTLVFSYGVAYITFVLIFISNSVSLIPDISCCSFHCVPDFLSLAYFIMYMFQTSLLVQFHRFMVLSSGCSL